MNIAIFQALAPNFYFVFKPVTADMHTTNIFFVEEVPSSFEPGGGVVISLNPQASLELSDQGIPFSIVEDFVAPGEVFSQEKAYFDFFSDWLDALDEQLVRHYPALKSLDIRPARLYSHHLRVLIDPFIVKAFELGLLLDRLQPAKVVLLHQGLTAEPVDFTLYVRGPSLASLLLPRLCKTRAVLYGERLVLRPASTAQRAGIVTSGKSWLKRRIRGVRQFIDSAQPVQAGTPSALFVGGQGWTDEIEQAAAEMGHQVIQSFTLQRKVKGKRPVPTQILSLESFWRPLDEYAGISWSDLIADRLEYFAQTLCADIEAAALSYRDEFARRRVRLVVCANKHTVQDFAALALAAADPEILAVQITHGYPVFADLNSRLCERPCDLYITIDEETREYYKSFAFSDDPDSVQTARQWMARYVTKSEEDRTGKALSTQLRRRVLYVPTLYRGDLRRIDGANYSDTWYFRHQVELLKFFGAREDCDFIWKSLPDSGGTRSLIPLLIERLGIRNVRYEVGSLAGYFSESDLAINDYPSTPVLETILTSIPTLALWHESLRVRPGVTERLGKLLRDFVTTEEAIALIDDFLRSDPADYVLKMEMSTAPVREVIEKYAASKGITW